MGRIVKITESDLTNIVKRVINEQDEKRVVRGILFGKNGVIKAKREGLTPFYFDFSVYGDYKMVEVTSYSEELDRKQIFLLKPDEIEKSQKHLDIVNELVKKKLEQFKLYQELILGTLVEKIMK